MSAPRRVAAVIALAIAPAAYAGSVRTDGTVGPAQSLAGPGFLIPQALGRLVGQNLFQSFGTFTIDPGESATFTTSTPGIANVICRVTGGSPSVIDGLLRLTPVSGTPAFWFMNPAGVMFGQGASIDVPGAFHVTTAEYIKFGDGNLYADAAKTSTFSAASPEAFGFLGNAHGVVGIDGGALLATPNAPIDIVASDVSMDGGSIQNLAGGVRIVAQGAQAGEVALSGASASASGVLSIINGGLVRTTAVDRTGGDISLSAGNLVVSGPGSGLFSVSRGAGDAGGIDVLANGKVSILAGGVVSTEVNGTGSARPITIVAGSMDVDGTMQPDWTTGIESDANAQGRGADIRINVAGSMTVVGGGQVGSSSNAQGRAGDMDLTAASLLVDGANSDNPTGILNDSNAAGRAGDVRISLSGPLTMVNGGVIRSDAWGDGNAGDVDVKAQSILINGVGAPDSFTGILSNANDGAGNGGQIRVTVSGPVTILDGGRISSDTSSAGNAGDVAVTAQSLTIDGLNAPGGNLTRISSDARDTSTGNAGAVTVTVSGPIVLRNTGAITSEADASGNAGAVTVSAQSLLVDGSLGSDSITGISSDAVDGSTGNAGRVHISVSGAMTLTAGGTVSSDAYGPGHAGTVEVSAGTLTLDGGGTSFITGISSDALSTGDAGSVRVSVAGALTMRNGGTISSDTYDAGNAGTVSVSAHSLSIDAGDGTFFTGISSDANQGSSGNAGDVRVNAGSILLANSGRISSSTYAAGNAGDVAIQAGSMNLDGGLVQSLASRVSTGHAGNVDVNVSGPLVLGNGALIDSDTYSSGNAGSVTVAAQTLTLDGSASPGFVTGITSDANPGATGNAGPVNVSVSGAAYIYSGGQVSSSTWGQGAGGDVVFSAGSLVIDGHALSLVTGIRSQAVQGTGSAGSLRVTVAGNASILGDGIVSSSTFSQGNAGSIDFSAGALTVDGSGTSFATGVTSSAYAGSTGDAGSVRLNVSGLLSMAAGGEIVSGTFGAGNAGSITANLGSLHVDGGGSPALTGLATQADRGSTGNAGSVQVSVSGAAQLVNGGQVSSATSAAGHAGSINFSADSLLLDGGSASILTGITTSAGALSTGAAGSANVHVAHDLTMRAGAQISSSTSNASGAAGDVLVNAENIVVDGSDARGSGSTITARATAGSSGQTGNVRVIATGSITLSNNGNLSIQDDATVGNAGAIRPGTLSVSAPVIDINGGRITAASTGNVAASSIDVEVLDHLSMNAGLITTSSIDGNGGPIRIHGPGYAWLIDSQITTSVSGSANGNGGDIAISLPNLIMQNGFIQANTAAAHAAGGNVNIDVSSLIPEAASLVVGGNTAYVFDPNAANFNLIQAAAPTGVSGTIDVTAPVFDISGTLVGLSSRVLSGVPLGKTLCDSGSGSTLALTGRGALPESATDPLRIAARPREAASSPAALATHLPIMAAAGCK